MQNSNNMNKYSITIHFNDILKFSQDICKYISAGTVILLEGELGSGKTTLSRYIIRNIFQDHKMEIKSPTFSILEYYKSNNLYNTAIYHYDLYRIKHYTELEEINILENILSTSSIVIIEWPQIAHKLLEEFRERIIHIQISHTESTHNEEHTLKRQLTIYTTEDICMKPLTCNKRQ